MKKTLDFLKSIKKNNTKDWFDANKHQYIEAKEELEVYVNKLIASISQFDKAITPELLAKNCIFRIYKDVRFSKDKTPYKTNLGASMNPGGKKSPIPGYYLHIEPGNSFVAGGVYMPIPEHLAAIRQEIDYNGAALIKLMNKSSFKKYYTGLDEIDLLKTVPKGFDKDNAYLSLLKHKHFIVSYPLKDSDLIDAKGISKLTDAFKAMHPFLLYLREAMPH